MKFTLKLIKAALVWEQENSQSVPGTVPWGLKANMDTESSVHAEKIYYQIMLTYSKNQVLEFWMAVSWRQQENYGYWRSKTKYILWFFIMNLVHSVLSLNLLASAKISLHTASEIIKPATTYKAEHQSPGSAISVHPGCCSSWAKGRSFRGDSTKYTAPSPTGQTLPVQNEQRS